LLAPTHGFFEQRPGQGAKIRNQAVTAGCDAKAQKGFVNWAVFHGSTVLTPTAEHLRAHRGAFTYGRHGSPTTRTPRPLLGGDEGRRPGRDFTKRIFIRHLPLHSGG
jgi:cystathionine beta-lyase